MPRTNLQAALANVRARAAAQHGVFTLDQARALGLPRQAVSYYAQPGRTWQRVLPETYELTGLPPDPLRIMLAAQVWAGPGAVLSHRAAGLILGFDGIGNARPELWTSGAIRSEHLVVHHGTVPATDVTTTGPLRHTTIVRTVLDLAAVLDDDTLELVIEFALRTNPRRERQFLAAATKGRPGCRALLRVLDRRPPGAPPTESELETRYVQLLRTVDVPPPVRQFRVVTDSGRVLGRLDLCWPEAELWVELDGRDAHDNPDAFVRDRQRQNKVTSELQWLPLRFTWPDVVHHPAETAQATESAYHRRLGWIRHGR